MNHQRKAWLYRRTRRAADMALAVILLAFVAAFILGCLLVAVTLLTGAVEYQQTVTTTTLPWMPGGVGGVKPE